ncbi:MAG: hypothetical protein ABI954_06060 [Pyrinomonadaceae bacterium]
MKNKAWIIFVLSLLLLVWTLTPANAQEVLTNAQILEMSRAGLSKQIILTKIRLSAGNYDVTANALIELKKAGVEDEIVTAMFEVFNKTDKQNLNIVEQTTPKPIIKPDASKTAAQLLREAHTVFFVKHSLYPSLEDLESSVLKRSGWHKFNLAVTRNRDEADLIVEINHEFLTHYAFRVIDQKTGKVLTASGVTSVGGALAGNIADKLIKRFNEVL